MHRLHRLALAALALAATSLAAPAFAAPKGACLWGALTDANRATLVQGYREKGPAYLAEIQVDASMENALRSKCAVKPEEEVLAGEILGSILLEKGADTVLFEKGRIARGTLDRNWLALPEADREKMRMFGLAAMRDEADGPALQAAIPIIAKFTIDMKLPDESLNNQVFNYMLGRAIREAREAGRT